MPERFPEPALDAPPGELKRRSAWTSTFVASLEVAKQGDIVLHQDASFSPIRVSRPTECLAD